MQNNTPSAPAPTSVQATGNGPTVLDRLIAFMDPMFPSVVVPPALDTIGEPSRWYDGKVKPDFVQADDEGWGVT